MATCSFTWTHIPGQGGLAAYNPYASTTQSTVLLLPVREDPAGQIDGMYADFAVWVTDSQQAYFLRWSGGAWVNDGELATLNGAYTFSAEPGGNFTALDIPLVLLGSPAELGLVGMAVDAEEGPSGGLRVWSILPYANPADSLRVVAGAPGPDRPHKLILTDRYTLSLADGTCFAPEASLKFSLRTANDGFDYDLSEDLNRTILPLPSVRQNALAGLFDPYDNPYQDWLTNVYCPLNPTFGECRSSSNPPPHSRQPIC